MKKFFLTLATLATFYLTPAQAQQTPNKEYPSLENMVETIDSLENTLNKNITSELKNYGKRILKEQSGSILEKITKASKKQADILTIDPKIRMKSELAWMLRSGPIENYKTAIKLIKKKEDKKQIEPHLALSEPYIKPTLDYLRKLEKVIGPEYQIKTNHKITLNRIRKLPLKERIEKEKELIKDVIKPILQTSLFQNYKQEIKLRRRKWIEKDIIQPEPGEIQIYDLSTPQKALQSLWSARINKDYDKLINTTTRASRINALLFKLYNRNPKRFKDEEFKSNQEYIKKYTLMQTLGQYRLSSNMHTMVVSFKDDGGIICILRDNNQWKIAGYIQTKENWEGRDKMVQNLKRDTIGSIQKGGWSENGILNSIKRQERIKRKELKEKYNLSF